MNLFRYSLISILILLASAPLLADLQHTSDPRKNIENLLSNGDFVWVMDDSNLKSFLENSSSIKNDSAISNISWNVKGGAQEWILTRTRLTKKNNKSFIKKERFRITIIMVDNVWITRTKYRYKKGPLQDMTSIEITDNTKSNKFKARCRISKNKIVLSLSKKKSNKLFKFTKKNNLLQINHTTNDLRDWTVSFKKK
ncbi:MAG: hypothetical protein GY757_47515 [bacterium]|nr:hypothetical protein [bacterium]